MRLIRLHIENFGKLSHFDIDFDKNPYVILEDNGWGKTTLATFIKVMFYGFSGESKKALNEREREKYRPWNKGLYGGTIIFSYKGREYEINKIFGSKERDDSCVLCDANTRLILSDWDEAHLGQDLFLLDEAAFKRSVFLAQNDVRVHEDGKSDIADSISAKIGNLSDATDDVNRYESVMNRLNDLLNKLTPNRATGSIKQMDAHISSMQNAIRQEDNIQTLITELEGKLNAEKRLLSDGEQQRIKQEEEFLQNAKRGELLAKKETFKRLWSEYEAGKSTLDKMEESYVNGLPSEEDINAHLEAWGQRNSLLNGLDSKQVQLEYALKEQQLEREKRDARLLEEQLIKEEIDRRLNGRRKIATVLLILAGLLMVTGVVVGLVLSMLILGVEIIGGGVILLVSGLLVMPFPHQDDDDEEDEDEEQEDTVDTPQQADEVLEIDNNTQNEATVEEEEDGEAVLAIREEIRQNRDMIAVIEVNTQEFFRHYCISYLPDNVESSLYDIRQQLSLYHSHVEEMERKRNEIKAFENANDMTAIMNVEETEDGPVMLQEERENISQRMREATEAIHLYERQLEEQYERLHLISDTKEELNSLLEERDSLMHKFEMIVKTRDFLRGAKENFSAKYRKPLLDGFKKYYNLLCADSASEFQLDANIHMSVRELGEPRSMEQMSSGSRDLSDICLRLALVDAMYQEEKPFLILDDPFVNLDEGKTNRALHFLQEVGKEYQVIYFTCHESRA